MVFVEFVEVGADAGAEAEAAAKEAGLLWVTDPRPLPRPLPLLDRANRVYNSVSICTLDNGGTAAALTLMGPTGT